MIILETDAAYAIELLTEATSLPGADPVFYFHLALAHQRKGSRDLARNALKKARADGFSTAGLSERERRMLNDLEKWLDRQKSG